ncbi:hypothetical protein VNI00_007893 [Paramarasmius palmivorus]|uniref:Carboxylic ester hydrolase n=1 Tax=Paramarasmius palmivorus TaxID=297713 RepID=A0AAW0D185_9AGAR
MRTITAAFLLCTTLGSAIARLPSNLPRATLTQGTFVGNFTKPSAVFFGNIPYAEPPLGDLRFRKPVIHHTEAEGSTEEYDARNFGNFCLQQPAYTGVGSEDCLTLNIWKPANATETDRLPVLVYIHGGGLNYDSPIQNKMGDIVEETGIIGVNMAYRLNFAGFATSKDLVEDGIRNAGLWDQRAALEWVQRNIEKFGGDPTRVTIAGESAGAAAVLYQMFGNGGDPEGLFHGAIMSSISTSFIATVEDAEEWYKTAGETAGCDNSTTIAQCLRQSSELAFRAASNAVYYKYQLGPLFDDFFITDLPSRLISSGKFAKVPVIAGHTTYDAFLHLASVKPIGAEAFGGNTTEDFWEGIARRTTNFTDATKAQVEEMYPLSEEFSSQWERAGTALTDMWFGCLDWLVVNASIKAGVNDSYLFRWDAADPSRGPWNGLNMAVHATDLYYMWEGYNFTGVAAPAWRVLSGTENALAREVHGYWAGFTRTVGTPNFDSRRVDWQPASQTQGGLARLVIALGNDSETASIMENTPAIHEERCTFWSAEVNWDFRF